MFAGEDSNKKFKTNARRKQVRRACSNCRNAHAGCDNQRPCSRCVSKGLAASCQEWSEDGSQTPKSTSSSFSEAPESNLLQKRSREKICNHGWDAGDPSLLSQLMTQDFNDVFDYLPPTQTQFNSKDNENLVFRTSDAEEIYTSISLPGTSECQLCQDCAACENHHPHSHKVFSREERDSELRNLKEEILRLKESNTQLRALVQDSIQQQRDESPHIVSPSLHEPADTGIPIISQLPHPPLSSESLTSCPKKYYPANPWYNFTGAQNSQASSVWLVQRFGRSDEWTLLECNQSFIDLIQKPIQYLNSSYTMLDLVPHRFKASTSELLQQIINSDVDSATAKSLWKQGDTETCVNTVYTIFQTTPQPVHTPSPQSFANPIEQDKLAIHDCYQYPSAKNSCESTGCGAFNTKWTPNVNEPMNEHDAPSNACIDQTAISASARASDRIVRATHDEVEFYDDFIRIGDKVHEQTFSIQVATIIALAQNSSANIKLKSQRFGNQIS